MRPTWTRRYERKLRASGGSWSGSFDWQRDLMATKDGNSISQILPAELKPNPLHNQPETSAFSTAVIHRRVIGLFAANILSIVVVGASFVVYSRLLSPPEFGLYAVALSTATLLALILDAGLKTTIIKSETE